MSFPIYSTIAEVTASIRSSRISATEVVESTLGRIAKCEPQLHCFAHLDAEGARTQARAAEIAVTRGDKLGPLHGVPVTIKSNIDVAGWPCTAGSLLRSDYVPQRDAPLIARLRGAGAI